MPTNGIVGVMFPNRTLDAGVTVTASNEATSDADNVLTERVDKGWEPANIDTAQWIQLTWPSAVVLSGVAIPSLQLGGTTPADPETINLTVEDSGGVVSASADYKIEGSGGATARNELARSNLGPESADYSELMTAHRFASYRTWTAASTTILKLTFTPAGLPSGSTLKLPHIVAGHFWQDPNSDSGGMEGSYTRGEVFLPGGSGQVRRTINCRFPWMHDEDYRSRWLRQSMFRGGAQKWFMVLTPDSSQDHTFYDGGFIWGYRQPLAAQRIPSIDSTTNRHAVSLAIRESLNGEFAPG